MRLSEERINVLAQQISDVLFKKQLIRYRRLSKFLPTLIEKVLLEDLRFEDELDEQVRQILQRMDKPVPENSPEWNALFREKKEEMAVRRNYVL